MWLLRVASFYHLLTFNQHLFSKEKASLSLEVKLITKAVKVITKAGETGTRVTAGPREGTVIPARVITKWLL